jgi:recombination protein RecT
MTDTALIKSALAEQTDRGEAETIYNALDLHRASLERKVPTGVLTYAYAEAALKTELRANQKLREADPAKVLGAFSYGLQLGLVPGPLGLVHFIPFGSEVVFLVGYRGYIELAYRSGLVKDVSAELVYEGDEFRDVRGSNPKIVHEVTEVRAVDRENGTPAIVAAYAVAHLKSGGTVSRVIYEADWVRARSASQLGAKNRGPWTDDFAAMILKTAYRRLEPKLPKTGAAGLAEAWDEQPAEPVDDPVLSDE